MAKTVLMNAIIYKRMGLLLSSLNPHLSSFMDLRMNGVRNKSIIFAV